MYTDYFDFLTWELNHKRVKIYLNVLFVVALLFSKHVEIDLINLL